MDPYIPVETPRVVAAMSGELAAVHEPARVTLISVPRCEPYGVLGASSETQVGWLGNLLITIKGARVRVIDPRRPAIVAQVQLPDEKLALRACTSEYASLQMRMLRARAAATIAGPCTVGFIVVDGETFREWDAKTAQPKRTWKAGGSGRQDRRRRVACDARAANDH